MLRRQHPGHEEIVEAGRLLGAAGFTELPGIRADAKVGFRTIGEYYELVILFPDGHLDISPLAIRVGLESPEVSSNVFWLVRQRQEVGEEGFAEILGNLLDADSVRNVIEAVDSFQNGSEPG